MDGRQSNSITRSIAARRCTSLHIMLVGRRVQKNFADKSEAKRVAKQILGELSNDADAVEAMATPELESLIAARRVLAPNYALHVAVEEHAQAIAKLGKATLREAVEFFLRHNRADVPRLTLAEIAEQFADSRRAIGPLGSLRQPVPQDRRGFGQGISRPSAARPEDGGTGCLARRTALWRRKPRTECGLFWWPAAIGRKAGAI